jgi:F420-dependent oxidoreductase-like protein
MTTKKHPVRFGLQTGQQNVAWRDLLELWRKADRWGYDSLWNFDHFYAIYTDPASPCLEGWTTLSALAQATERARIGHLVCGNTYRHPCVTAKMAASLDHIAGGRLNLGLGAGWFELEHTSLGLDFKTVRGRLEALEESLRIIRGMLAGEKVSLAGKHYRVHEAFSNPGPLQPGGVPIMIGGEGRKILLRLVARYADMWNAFGSPAHMRELIDVIRGHADHVGRDADEIEKTVMLPLCYTNDAGLREGIVTLLAGAFGASPQQMSERMISGGKQECLDRVRAYVDAGVTHFIFMCIAPYAVDQLQGFAEDVAPYARAD